MHTITTLISFVAVSALLLMNSALQGNGSISPSGSDPQNEVRKAGETRTDAKGIEQVWVPAECFTMGEDNAQAWATRLKAPNWVLSAVIFEGPAHEVCISKGYWIDKYEVTNAAFQKFVEDDGYKKQEYWSENGWKWLSGRVISKLPEKCEESRPNYPRTCVTWYEAEAYARWRDGRLPTEAEWELAARGPESLIFPWGNEWDAKKANVVNSGGTTPVGNYPDGVSWVGAHDMAGNAMEWVQDWLSSIYYGQKVKDDPTGPQTGSKKVEKGGWWGSNPYVARASYRHFEDAPTYQDHHIGFRIVTPEAEK